MWLTCQLHLQQCTPCHSLPQPSYNHPTWLPNTHLHTPLSQITPPQPIHFLPLSKHWQAARCLCKHEGRKVWVFTFQCNERFMSGHRCKRKTQQLLWVNDDKEKNEKEELLSPRDTTPREGGLTDGPTSTSLFVSSLVDLISPHLMKVCRKITTREVFILIDSSASKNFILNDLVLELHIRLSLYLSLEFRSMKKKLGL